MQNFYADFTEKVLNLPLWVKEVLYFMLKNNLKNTLPCSDIDIREEALYQYLCPVITYEGKKECERLKKEEPDSLECKFLDSLIQNLSIIEITINNGWTLEETSQIYYTCIENQLVAKPESPIISAKAAYFANRIRIGEYLKRIGLIDVDQLETAMRLQKESEMAHEKKGFASILVEMELVTRNDTDNILLIKQESRKRCIMDFNSNAESPDKPAATALPTAAAQRLKQLEYENVILKTKLRELLKIGK